MRQRIVMLCFGLCLLLPCCFSVPHYVIPKTDISARTLHPEVDHPRILIASDRTAFKEQVIEAVVNEIKNRNIQITITGLKTLKNLNASDFDAIMLLNQCWSWSMDQNVIRFVEKYPAHPAIIVLTTSGDNQWLPKKRSTFDALSGASKTGQIDETARLLITKIEAAIHP